MVCAKRYARSVPPRSRWSIVHAALLIRSAARAAQGRLDHHQPWRADGLSALLGNGLGCCMHTAVGMQMADRIPPLGGPADQNATGGLIASMSIPFCQSRKVNVNVDVQYGAFSQL